MSLPISSVCNVLLIANLLPAVVSTWLPFPRGHIGTHWRSGANLPFCYSQPSTRGWRGHKGKWETWPRQEFMCKNTMLFGSWKLYSCSHRGTSLEMLLWLDPGIWERWCYYFWATTNLSIKQIGEETSGKTSIIHLGTTKGLKWSYLKHVILK